MSTFYDEIGGMETIRAIVDRFYEGVATDELLRPMYPEDELGPAAERLTLFLAQYWGGPTTYHEERGHPALRMRHAPFAIGTDERDRWLTHMRSAIEAMAPAAEVATALMDYFDMAADSLRNQPV